MLPSAAWADFAAHWIETSLLGFDDCGRGCCRRIARVVFGRERLNGFFGYSKVLCQWVRHELSIDPLFDFGQQIPLSLEDEREGNAVSSHASCSAYPVDVVIDVVWQIVVDDVRDCRDVDTSANNVGCDQDLDRAVSKRFEYRISLRLIHVAMDRTESHIGERRDTMQHFFKLVMQFGRSEFGTAKDNGLRRFLAC